MACDDGRAGNSGIAVAAFNLEKQVATVLLLLLPYQKVEFLSEVCFH
jgi:hypothetical protein